MHRDTKVGLALGVLLIGLVGAFFFRHEPAGVEAPPQLKSPQALDEQIARKENTPYLVGVETDVNLAPVQPLSRYQPPEPPQWELPDFLKGEVAAPGARPLASQGTAPDPIRPLDAAVQATSPRIPPHNNAWTVVAGSGEAARSAAAPKIDAGERTHVVQSGDTLSGIAGQYLGSTSRFLEVYEANRDRLRSPNDLRVGVRLRIPGTAEQNGAANSVLTQDSPAARPTSSQNAGPEARVPRPEANPVSTDSATPADQPANGTSDDKDPGTTPRFVPFRRSPYAPRGASTRKLSQAPPTVLVSSEGQFEKIPAALVSESGEASAEADSP